MNIIKLQQPGEIVFGNGCSMNCAEALQSLNARQVLLVTTKSVLARSKNILDSLANSGCTLVGTELVGPEPTRAQFDAVLERARKLSFDVVLGIGGGSALDVSKLIASLARSSQSIGDTFGIGRLAGREISLVCIPTTAGTGSEVSPIAVLLDEADKLKKGMVSRYLIPDVAMVDPLLTLSVPQDITAATGMDALTHCIEGYINKFAHPTTDTYALRGIELISGNLLKAVKNGDDSDARANVALGSLLGGLCLGPVGTAGVHALSYPLGGQFRMAHGVSNSMLLPHVARFNLPQSPQRHADVARAMGIPCNGDTMQTALRGVEFLEKLSRDCAIPQHLADFGIPREAIPGMANSAMQVTRLLKNNVRTVTESDACAIYEAAF